VPLRTASLPQLPSLKDFLLSPGFAGGLVALAAVTALIAALIAIRRGTQRHNKQLAQQDRHHQEIHAATERREAIERCWERLTWLVKTASTEPSAIHAEEQILGLGPELTLAILEGLRDDALDLNDTTLAQAVAVYLAQYSLALGQRIGPLPEVLAAPNGTQDRLGPGKDKPEPPEESAKAKHLAPATAGANQGRQQ
jgi:hypothetical protein